MSENSPKVNLLGMGLSAMEQFFTEVLGEKRFRAVQVLKWIHQRGVDNFDDMTDVSKSLREKLSECAEIVAPEVTYKKYSKDGTRKWVMKMPGGSAVETVFYP